MAKSRFFILSVSILLFSLHLPAEEELEFSLVNETKSPIPRVAGSVNVVSGNWVDQSIHHEASGPDPYVVAHSYVSSSLEEGTLADGWDFYHPSELEVFQPKGISYIKKDLSCGFKESNTPFAPYVREKSHASDANIPVPPTFDNRAILFYRDAGGATVVFKGVSSSPFYFEPKLKKTGYMVLGSIDNPVRRDIKRTSITWEPASDHWIVTLGDGTRRVYSRTDKHKYRPRPDQKSYFKRTYHIKEEFLPSGNRRQYHYDADKELTCILTLSSDEKDVLHTVGFRRHHDEVRVMSSEGLTTCFSLKKLNDRDTAYVVAKIDRPGKETLSYSYSDKSSRHARRINKRNSGVGRCEEVKFYREGKNDVGKKVVEVSGKEEKKYLENRVREVWTKDLAANPLTVSHAFIYKKGEHHNLAKVQERDGASTIYFWDKSFRPSWIGYKNSAGELLQAEHFIWGEGLAEGRLLRRTVLDKSKKPLFDREFCYNPRGDIIGETLRGSFTGRPHKRLKLNDKKEAQGGEALFWEAKYSDDGRALKIEEIGPLGNRTYYEYEPSRQLMTARFTCNYMKIIKREFFSYDHAGICVESIVDDGSSKHKSHFTNVSRRTIHRVTPRRRIPFYGAPEEEQWLVYTRKSGEQLVQSERYIRDEHGRAIAKELVDGFGVVQKRWTYSYDNVHRLTESCDPTGRVEQYSYDDAGRVSMKRTPEATLTFTYDLFDRVIEERKTFPDGTSDSLCRQYDLPGRVVTEIDGRGREKTTVKNLAGRLVKTILPAHATEEGAKRPELTYSYSGATERHTSPCGAVTKVIRSATGKPLVTTSPSGAETFFFYDARNRLVEQKDPSGLVTCYEYDAFDRPTKIEQKANGKSLSVITKTYRGVDLIEERYPTKVINYLYDSFGRKVQEKVTDLLTTKSVTTRTAYDSISRPIRIFHDDIGTEEQLTYDMADRVIERRVVGTDGSLLSIATKSYDLAGRVIEEGVGRAGSIARTKTSYGAYGLPASVTYPDGTVTTFVYKPLCRWHDGHVYFQKVTTDARGVVTEELLDSNDEVRLATVRDPFGAVISRRTVTFSILGKPVLIEEEAIASGHKTTVVKTRLEYDTVGQLVSCTLAAGTPESATWRYSYDKEGRKIEEIKPSGVSFASSYDVKGRLASLKSSDGTISWQYRYNSQDLPEDIVNGVSGCTTHRKYNGLGAMTKETLETGLTLLYDVQATGLLSSITYPDASVSTYSYAHGRLKRIDRKGYTYQVTSRDICGMITEASLPSSTGLLTQAIDVMGRKTLMQHDAFSEERSVFDPVGCCLERTIDKKNEVFTYDYLCQLTNDNGRSASYDSLFRRTSTEGKAAVHNARNQILAQGESRFQYDIDGRRRSDDRFEYGYDACDRLISVEDKTTRFEYSYDPFNRRLSSSKFVKDGTKWKFISKEKFLWQGDCEIGSVGGDGKFLSLRVLGEGLGGEVGAAVLFEVRGNVYIPIHDISGHVRACLNTNGEVVEKLSYTAFGLESRTADITPWTFASKRQDEETGFLYFGRRYYEPQTATWLTQDPLGLSAGPNLYAYVKNNPINAFDIFGLIDRPDDSGFFGGMWDRCCDFFGGLCDSFFGGSGGSAQASDSSVEAPTSRWDDNKNDTRPVVLRNGLEIEAGKKYSDMMLIYPYGSVKEFLTANQGQDLGKSVFVGIFGAGTTLHESCLRAQEFMERNSKTAVAVILLYNATHGLPNDFVEAALNTLGFELTVGKTLKDEFVGLLRDCLSNNIKFTADFICHSQGVSIGSNILASQEFAGSGTLSRYTGNVVNFGGPKICPGATNYMALGDPVFLLSLLNPFAMINSFWNGELSFVCPTTLEFPHNFSGSAYQGALAKYMSKKGSN